MKILDSIYLKISDRYKTNDILRYGADQLRNLAWAAGGLNLYFNFKISSLLFVVPAWCIFQYLAVYVLTKVDSEEDVK